jgi:hypothetical protein
MLLAVAVKQALGFPLAFQMVQAVVEKQDSDFL